MPSVSNSTPKSQAPNPAAPLYINCDDKPVSFEKLYFNLVDVFDMVEACREIVGKMQTDTTLEVEIGRQLLMVRVGLEYVERFHGHVVPCLDRDGRDFRVRRREDGSPTIDPESYINPKFRKKGDTAMVYEMPGDDEPVGSGPKA